MGFDLPDDYNDVPARIRQFRAKHPEGSLRCADLARPYSIEIIDGQAYVIYVAAAYRSPDDPAPGIGIAWELVPGKTPFTKGSELQNAETSAWGRAIIAAGAADAKRVSTDEDVRNARAANDMEPLAPLADVSHVIGRLEKLLPAPGYPPDWKEAKLPSISTLKRALAGEVSITEAQYREMDTILEAVE